MLPSAAADEKKIDIAGTLISTEPPLWSAGLGVEAGMGGTLGPAAALPAYALEYRFAARPFHLTAGHRFLNLAAPEVQERITTRNSVPHPLLYSHLRAGGEWRFHQSRTDRKVKVHIEEIPGEGADLPRYYTITLPQTSTLSLRAGYQHLLGGLLAPQVYYTPEEFAHEAQKSLVQIDSHGFYGGLAWDIRRFYAVTDLYSPEPRFGGFLLRQTLDIDIHPLPAFSYGPGFSDLGAEGFMKPLLPVGLWYGLSLTVPGGPWGFTLSGQAGFPFLPGIKEPWKAPAGVLVTLESLQISVGLGITRLDSRLPEE